MASLTGAATAVNELIAIAVLPNAADVLGPVAVREPQRGAPQGEADEEARVRALVRAPRSEGARLAAALKAAAAIRSARKAPDPVRIQLDPLEIV